MKIPLVDLDAQLTAIGDEIRPALEGVLRSQKFIGGPEVEAFEREFAAFCGTARAVGCSNGTAAVHLALKALGVGPGDEVVLPTMTFIATAEAVTAIGAKPVFADCDPGDLLLSAVAAEAAITPRTKALLPVHLFGQPCDMDALGALARKRGLLLVEDAAQAHGAEFGGKRAGALGDAAAFSFYPGKNLGAYGDAGAVTTSDPKVAETVAMLRDHGRRPSAKYEHELDGFNHRMDGFQGAVLRVKLRRLASWNERRAAGAAFYDERLRGTAAVRVLQRPGRTSAHHLYVVRVPQRDRVLKALQAAGVGAGIHYPIPVHLQPAYAGRGLKRGSFPAAEKAADEILSLPLYPEMTEAQASFVVETLRGAL